MGNVSLLAAYERYRTDSMSDPECREAFQLARDTRCINRYERRFLRPSSACPRPARDAGYGPAAWLRAELR
jgi:hypothetical protein